ncbi:RdgB/HAM1 family non-canonical purine NTP pyrophosphatase [Amnibacterium sp. CER49]|uniref:RdgB/HAM1 family non-canonical purine NTP pyrophosphatase n=1 Tax=Amnibacterium sp. CER49 TaxID=3039161 RepID=UPI002446C791|nr:RdgB/HAM1 family non-canonical purine NTP pyrophosphatase [Amnibacterium sp. CER49]MDH2445290.1 RdgB/HAM1 family non-canonical purine NTP pyrophosphatase [Amnibacterium sp. CER49]
MARFPRIVLATGNAHKVAELRAILEPLLPGVELVPYGGPSPVEDGDTFVANALIKARAAAQATGLPALADDSGIAVDALGGAPGIHSARFSGTGRDDDNRALLLERLRGAEDRRARFVCAAVLVAGEERLEAEAVWPGVVLEAERGEGGFGYDPLFEPDGLGVSVAELTPEQKNTRSHRAQAFRRLAEQLD